LINFNELNEKNRTIISYQNIDRVQNGKRYWYVFGIGRQCESK
jgi:hypothetical protein